MEFRPCIDIHDGKVKQIVGASLMEADRKSSVKENFVAKMDAAFYANLYQKWQIKGGHVILLNGVGTEGYEKTRQQAMLALRTYPGGLQVGGGITAENAVEYIEAGASHVVVTSYVFRDGKIDYARLCKMKEAVGKEHLVLDLSCRKKKEGYVIVTDRWQKETKEYVTEELLDALSLYCDEYLIHAVDVEGKANGIECELVKTLGDWGRLPVTYAGGVHNFEDLCLLKELGRNKVNVTIGSALDLFGGNMKFEEVIAYTKKEPIL